MLYIRYITLPQSEDGNYYDNYCRCTGRHAVCICMYIGLLHSDLFSYAKGYDKLHQIENIYHHCSDTTEKIIAQILDPIVQY